MNDLQDPFDLLHSLIIIKYAEEIDDLKRETVKRELFNLISSYNKICRSLGLPIKHTVTLEHDGEAE